MQFALMERNRRWLVIEFSIGDKYTALCECTTRWAADRVLAALRGSVAHSPPPPPATKYKR